MTRSDAHRLAVMQRRASPPGELDFFPTPPWGTRAFLAHAVPVIDRFAPRAITPTMSVWDPCCGEGHMSRVLTEWFAAVLETDVHPYGDHLLADFLDPLHGYLFAETSEWIVMNPPFDRAAAFINLALERAQAGVAALVRAGFCEGQGRHRDLFAERPPHFEFQIAERLPMVKGRWVVNAKTATSYVWLVWLTHPPHDFARHGTRKFWIPPCRHALTRPDDPIRFGGWHRTINPDPGARDDPKRKWVFRRIGEQPKEAA